MKKIKYEKPTSLDAGKVASFLGAQCSNGIGNLEGCAYGTDPSNYPYCPDGYQATGNCWTYGNTAIQGCNVGVTAGWGCSTGNTP